MKKGDLSKFIEDAVRWRLLDEAAQRIKARNKPMSAKQIDVRISARSRKQG